MKGAAWTPCLALYMGLAACTGGAVDVLASLPEPIDGPEPPSSSVTRPRPDAGFTNPPPAPKVVALDPEAPPAPDHCRHSTVDPRQLTALVPDGRSHWLQPWRGYQDVWAFQRVLDAPVYRLHLDRLDLATAERRVRTLAGAGIRRVAFAVPWGDMDFDRPEQLGAAGRERLRRWSGMLWANGQRPLVLLEGLTVDKAPSRQITVRMATSAAAGTRLLSLEAASAAEVVPGRTLVSVPGASPLLVTALEASAGTVAATLSRPLPAAMPEGAQRWRVLRFEPFTVPTLSDGRPNPSFAASLQGYVQFVTSVLSEVRAALGSDQFDVVLGADGEPTAEMLDVSMFHGLASKPAPDGDATPLAILEAIAAAVRGAGETLARVRLVDGFVAGRWWWTAARHPPGFTALGRSLDVPALTFPEDARPDPAPPLDTEGRPDGVLDDGLWRETAVPRYRAYFPELPLTAILGLTARAGGTLIRDLAPTASVDPRGAKRGRTVGPAMGPAAENWITSFRFPGPSAVHGAPALTRDQVQRVWTKALLRTLLAYVAKGVSTIVLELPEDDGGAVVDWDARDGGPVLGAIRRLLTTTSAAPPSAVAIQPDAVEVLCNGRLQFDALDGHPGLGDRDVLAVFPFAVSNQHVRVVVYVMSRDLLRAEAGRDPLRQFDHPGVTIRLIFRGVGESAGTRSSIQFFDPYETAASTSTGLLVTGGTLAVDLQVTDTPRILTFTGLTKGP